MNKIDEDIKFVRECITSHFSCRPTGLSENLVSRFPGLYREAGGLAYSYFKYIIPQVTCWNEAGLYGVIGVDFYRNTVFDSSPYDFFIKHDLWPICIDNNLGVFVVSIKNDAVLYLDSDWRFSESCIQIYKTLYYDQETGAKLPIPIDADIFFRYNVEEINEYTRYSFYDIREFFCWVKAHTF